MGRALRALLVEDSESDAELLLRALRGGGFDPKVTRLHTKKAMRAALKDGPWDVVLCDYSMPRFSARAALEVVKEAGVDAPFIIVSGVIRIAEAVDMLKAGAHDFVEKDDLDRLVPAIARGLGETETRRQRKLAETALQVKVRQLAEAEQTAHVGHWRWDLGARTLEWSDEIYRIHGFQPGSIAVSVDKAIGFYHPDDREALRHYLDTAIETKERFEYQLRLLPPDEVVRHVWARGECELGDDGRVAGMFGIVQDVTQRKKAEDAIVETVHAISLTIEKRDPYTSGHQRRVAELCAAIGVELGLDRARVQGLCFGAMIHDLGKVWIPAEILNRPGKLMPAEFEIIKTHPKVGHDIIKGVEFPWPIAEMVLQHHERLDGTGYPHGLKDGEICLEAKILAVADVVEAMAAHRPYRPALGPDSGLAEILDGKGTRYDAEVVDACLRQFRQSGFAWES